MWNNLHLVAQCSLFALVTGLPSQSFIIPGKSCNTLHENLDGAVVDQGTREVADDTDDVCELRLVTTSQWMLMVDHVKIDSCPVILELYDFDVGTANVKPLDRFTCKSDNIGTQMVMKLKSNFVTIRLKTQKQKDYRFKIIFSAYKTGGEECDDFLCDNGNCIPRDLLCDGNDNCFDDSDEMVNISQLENKTSECLGRSCQYFSCADGQCIPGRFVCDGILDCPDQSDEDDDGSSQCGREETFFNTSKLILVMVITGVGAILIGLLALMFAIWKVRKRRQFQRHLSTTSGDGQQPDDKNKGYSAVQQ